MSLYSPDSGAVPKGTSFISLLSQRDLSLRVPINFVTLPGVSLTAACFPDQRYEDGAAATCVSNLLVMGFRRIHVDVYWDSSRRTWSLCPFQLGDGLGPTTNATTSSTALSATSSTAVASGSSTARPAVVQRDLPERQATDILSGVPTATVTSIGSPNSISVTTTINANSESTAGVSALATTGSTNGGQNILITAGPYSCSLTVGFDVVVDVLAGYLEDTETDLNATSRILILNLHAATSASNPTESAPEPAKDRMPNENNLLSSIIASNNSAYLYTPTELSNQRASLNASGNWFAVSENYRPIDSYFNIEQSGSKENSTDGWPSESYLELQMAKRVVAGFGSIDPQMRGYNFSGDDTSIFPPGYLTTQPPLTISDAGEVTAGCFYTPSTNLLSATNSSWAIGPLTSTSSLPTLLTAVKNLTACGLSPFLNQTLNNLSADRDYTPYQCFIHAHLWALQPSENLYTNRTSNQSSDGSNAEAYSCAALNAASGTWQAANCNSAHHGACRVANDPYSWQISNQAGIYQYVDAGCTGNTAFAVPRTSLESSYLLATWRENIRSESDPDDPLLWLDLNDLDVSGCWVNGQNASCPYQEGSLGDQGRKVIVPTVAGVIVFVLAALTIFVKCAANRRSSKRGRQRAGDGWDYEGVPS
ncbi:hypothetical protein LTR62_004373 [Meristemomyces frigidus]|uniref:Maintenance of telomere capping protein 6 n=1 Tax=Meristemomyces frigidus TaxID=1508187 RepID=A0AAN7TQU4_9PEZI|nr:hypothetical protein LTR62_004373 [Meristemomyces frigidus]